MSPDKQRIAIAYACGWKAPDDPEAMKLKVGWSMPEKWCMDPSGVLRFLHEIPDYLHDLNAIHEAERQCFPTSLQQYCRTLASIVYKYTAAADSNFLWQGWWFVHASAKERAEALLKTLNLWTDE